MDAQMIATMMMILHLIIISLYGLLLALFSYLLDFCFWRGNVFQFWLPMIARMIAKKRHPLKYESVIRIRDKNDQAEQMIDLVTGEAAFKVLGGCAICLNVWIGMISFPLIHAIAGHSYWYMPVYVLTASFFLRKIMKVD